MISLKVIYKYNLHFFIQLNRNCVIKCMHYIYFLKYFLFTLNNNFRRKYSFFIHVVYVCVNYYYYYLPEHIYIAIFLYKKHSMWYFTLCFRCKISFFLFIRLFLSICMEIKEVLVYELFRFMRYKVYQSFVIFTRVFYILSFFTDSEMLLFSRT